MGPCNYRIVWIIHTTGYTGHGDYCLSKEEADEYVVRLNRDYPDMNHWFEQEPESDMEA